MNGGVVVSKKEVIEPIGRTEDGKICCPKCGSTNLQAVSDTHSKGISFWKVCLCGLFGFCGANKPVTEHYWVCSDCGSKFKQ